MIKKLFYVGRLICMLLLLISQTGNAEPGALRAVFDPGVITDSVQSIGYNTTPALLTATASTGGSLVCSTYNYQWMISTDGINFTNISGATGQNYQPGALIATTWYKRMVTHCTSVGYTNIAKITVALPPPIVPGTVSPHVLNVNYGGRFAGPFTLSGVSGGTGSYTYQWQVSTNGSSFTNISGITTPVYNLTPAGLYNQNTYYRVAVASGTATAYSDTATVMVYPQLVVGNLAPGSQAINYGANAATLSSSGITGGTGTYTYQWQSSPNNSTWSDVAGATTATYTPQGLTSTTYYSLKVYSNGAFSGSNIANVTVYPQLQGGTVSPATQTAGSNSTPAQLTVGGISGGNGTYTYQWQTSADNAGWTNISGANAPAYQPAGLTSTAWFRVVVTSNGVSANSSAAKVNVYAGLTPGLVSPSNITVAYGTNIGLLTVTPATGGNCGGSYSYLWQRGNGTGWTNQDGNTGLTFNPGTFTSSFYYRVRVICGTDTVYTQATLITVGNVGSDYNFVREREIVKAGVTDTVTAAGLTDPAEVQQVTHYFDGLGRPIQVVARQASPQMHDIVVMQGYDAYDRPVNKYLPYTSPSGDGNYKTNVIGEQATFNAAQYPTDQFFYGQTVYEASPLNRPLAGYAPGNSWVGGGKGRVSQYHVNSAYDSVRLWTINAAAGSLPVTAGVYAPGMLFKNITQDEAGHQVIQYTDMEGTLVLKKQQLWDAPANGHSGWLNTYYVYDDLGNLRFVTQPKAVEWLIANGWNFAAAGGAQVAAELCFRYEYDSRHRTIIKKIPGAGETWMVYDMRDRLVMTQDSVLRSQHKWMFNRWDVLNREDSTGLITDPAHYNDLGYHLGLAAVSNNYPVVAAYTNEVLTMTYYDDYSWSASSAYSTAPHSRLISTYNTAPDYAVALAPYPVTRGMETGTKVKVLGSASTYLYDLRYYDDHGRNIQTQSSNYSGGIDTLTVQYGFSGQTLRTLLNHQKAGNMAQHHDVLSKTSYDAAQRPKAIWKNVDGASSDLLIDSLRYDESGQLRAKYFGSGIDSMVYDFNIRGWLTGINRQFVGGGTSHYFGIELAYDNTASVTGASYAAMYNGNIAGMTWKTRGDSTKRKYDFTYDNMNRLMTANFLQNMGTGWSNALVNYTVDNLSYDANGNILSMNQQGFKWNGSALIDQLSYNYLPNSNKLIKVSDAANDSLSQLGDFHYKGIKQDTDYRYDGNGSLLSDNNKGVDNIVYNYVGQPQQVHVIGKGNIVYTYDAAGNRLTKVTMDSLSRHATTTLYLGGFVYQHTDTITNPQGGTDTLQFLAHDEGRMRWAQHQLQTGAIYYGWENDFFERDHLGNTRMVLTSQKDTAQYAATMEGAYRAKENALFYNIPQTVYSRTLAGYPVDLSMTNPNDSVVMLNGMPGRIQGPAIILKVMAGDTIDVGAKSYYTTLSGSGTSSSITDVLTSLANGIVGVTGGGKGTVGQLNTTTSPLYGALNNFIGGKETTVPNKPRAYLNYMLLDDQYQYDQAKSGAIPVSNYAAGTLGTPAQSNIVAGKNGFVYVWVSNETQGWPVYFDNVSVRVRSGPILEETHYYPFGLTMAGISDKALKKYPENKHRFNGSDELQNKEFSDGSGLEVYDAVFRMYDPQIGRFWQIDPLSEMSEGWSTYSFVQDNPVSFNDALGLTDSVPGVKPMAAVIVTPRRGPHIQDTRPKNKPNVRAPKPDGNRPNRVDKSTPKNEPNPGGKSNPGPKPEPEVKPLEKSPGMRGGPIVRTVARASVITAVLVAIPLRGGGEFPNGNEGAVINHEVSDLPETPTSFKNKVFTHKVYELGGWDLLTMKWTTLKYGVASMDYDTYDGEGNRRPDSQLGGEVGEVLRNQYPNLVIRQITLAYFTSKEHAHIFEYNMVKRFIDKNWRPYHQPPPEQGLPESRGPYR
ncbi:DUF6443 domain-containing protein [Flavitalea sp. BT771]|uniref:DUF6443 domain-containing protein n=1 Tax=Flavitalea sp. BT771 TaxID=3063329 RepID=UPI0026E2382B|nr:DUF6443 domain-containing protein [Flavitalea sp. BT771]MDO6433190.1 DUF6443 domain-containing protein [Flavitalea sp. BT771]MDV6221534.1 DUF6443 domain-containing protein [Flavitalea sp. BT771]